MVLKFVEESSLSFYTIQSNIYSTNYLPAILPSIPYHTDNVAWIYYREFCTFNIYSCHILAKYFLSKEKGTRANKFIS